MAIYIRSSNLDFCFFFYLQKGTTKHWATTTPHNRQHFTKCCNFSLISLLHVFNLTHYVYIERESTVRRIIKAVTVIAKFSFFSSSSFLFIFWQLAMASRQGLSLVPPHFVHSSLFDLALAWSYINLAMRISRGRQRAGEHLVQLLQKLWSNLINYIVQFTWKSTE